MQATLSVGVQLAARRQLGRAVQAETVLRRELTDRVKTVVAEELVMAVLCRTGYLSGLGGGVYHGSFDLRL